MSATGETPGLTTTSSPTATPSTSPDRVDDAGDVAAGHVRQRRLRHARGDPQVHVVERAGDDPDAHVVGAERRAGRSPPAVRAGRLVQDPGVQQRPPSGVGHDRRASGSTVTSQRAYGPARRRRRPTAAAARRTSTSRSAIAADVRSSGAGTWVPRRQPAPRLPAGRGRAIVGVDLDDVGPAVVRVGPRGDVPAPEAVDVHHGERSARATTTGRGRRRGRRRASRRRPSVDPQHVDREPPTRGRRRRRATERGQQVAAGDAHRARVAGVERARRASASDAHVDAGRRRGRRARPTSRRGRIVTASTTVARPRPSATTPAERARSATSPAAARVAASGATTADLAGEVDRAASSCARSRRRSAPRRRRPRRGPRRPPRRRRRRRSRDRAGGARRARPSARRRRGPRSRPGSAASAARTSVDGNHGGGGGSGLRCSYTNADSSPASVAGVEPVEHARRAGTRRPAGRDSWNSRGEHVAALGQRPRRRRRRSPRRSSTSSTRSNSRASDWLWPSTRAAELDELALEALGLAGGPHPLAQLGVGLDRVRRPSASAPPPAVAGAGSLALPSARATSRRYSARFGLNTVGRRDGADRRGARRRSRRP